MRCLAVALSIWLLPSLLVAQSALSLDQCLKAISEFEGAFKSKTVTIKPTHGYNDSLGITVEVSVNDDGRFSRALQTLSGIGSQNEICVAGDQLIMATKFTPESDVRLGGLLECKYHAVSAVAMGHGMVGISPYDGVPFSRILSEPGTAFKSELSQLAGNPAPVHQLVALVPTYGEYTFWLTTGDRPVITQIRVKKRTGNRVMDSPLLGLTAIGAPRYVGNDPDRARQAEREAAAANEAKEQERELVLTSIEYEFASSGTIHPRKMEITSTSRYLNPPEFSFRAGIEVADVRPFQCRNPERAEFNVLKVRSEMPVQVVNEVGAAFILHDGRIVRLIDVESIGRMNGVRYRKPSTSSRYFLILALIVGIALAVLARSQLGRYRK